jgi:hypothetical protein
MAEPREVRILIGPDRGTTVLVVYPSGRTEPLVATIAVQKAAVQMVELAMYLNGPAAAVHDFVPPTDSIRLRRNSRS